MVKSIPATVCLTILNDVLIMTGLQCFNCLLVTQQVDVTLVHISFLWHSSWSKGAHCTHPFHYGLLHHSLQPHLHHCAEPRGRHSSDSDAHLARAQREYQYLTIQQPSQCLQCNTSRASVHVHHSLQFWHAIFRLWYLLLYSWHNFNFTITIYCNKWSSANFKTRICG